MKRLLFPLVVVLFVVSFPWAAQVQTFSSETLITQAPDCTPEMSWIECAAATEAAKRAAEVAARIPVPAPAPPPSAIQPVGSPQPAPSPCGFGRAWIECAAMTNSVTQGWYGYGGYGWFPGFDTCVYNPGNTNCTFGDLKIQGDSKSILSRLSRMLTGREQKLSKVDVWIQGPIALNAPDSELDNAPIDVIGVATDLDGIFDHPRRLPVGRYRVSFVLVEEALQLYEQTTRLYSSHDEKGKPMKLRVDNNRFANAPLKMSLVRKVREDVPAEKVLGGSPVLLETN